jgi:hypothetical protein
MRVQYKPSLASAHAYKSALNNDLGVYHLQTGAGIGSFFGNLLKKIIPIGKTLLHHGYEALKPELQKAAVGGIEYLANEGKKRVGGKTSPPAKTQKRKRRRRDALSPYK